MTYKAGDFLQVGTKTVRLNAETAAIANEAVSRAFGDCDACGKRVIADDLIFIPYGEDNSGGDGSFCDECAGV